MKCLLAQLHKGEVHSCKTVAVDVIMYVTHVHVCHDEFINRSFGLVSTLVGNSFSEHRGSRSYD